MESYTKAMARRRALEQKCQRIDTDLKHILVKCDQKRDIYEKDLFNIKARTLRFKETLAMFGKDLLVGKADGATLQNGAAVPYDLCTPGDTLSEEKRKKQKYKPKPGGKFVPEKQREINEAKEHELNMEMMSTGNKMRIRKAHAIAQSLEVIDTDRKSCSENPWGSMDSVNTSGTHGKGKRAKETRLPELPPQARRKSKHPANIVAKLKQKLPPVR